MNGEVSVIVSDVIEYTFCPRFIYFIHCLNIPQHEEKRYKVLKGRELHEIRKKINKGYFRKTIDCIGKEHSVKMCSDKYNIRGEVDEVLFLSDGTASPLDYKFAEFKGRTFRTHKFQLILYALLIKETYGIEVNKGFICYTRSNSVLKEIKIREKDFEKAISAIREVLEIIQKGIYPKKTKNKARCLDCCYRRICE